MKNFINIPVYCLISMNKWEKLYLHDYTQAQIKVYNNNSKVLNRLIDSLSGNIDRNGIFCIDLTVLFSKYIGETEKNLNNTFSSLERKNIILYFDEANELFDNRSDRQLGTKLLLVTTTTTTTYNNNKQGAVRRKE